MISFQQFRKSRHASFFFFFFLVTNCCFLVIYFVQILTSGLLQYLFCFQHMQRYWCIPNHQIQNYRIKFGQYSASAIPKLLLHCRESNLCYIILRWSTCAISFNTFSPFSDMRVASTSRYNNGPQSILHWAGKVQL